MINEKVYKLINEQINKEFFSAYLYLDMAYYYGQVGLIGFATWFEKQAKEEQIHALKFAGYLHDLGMKANLEAIAKPEGSYQNHLQPLKAALDHECYVTSSINAIMDEAKKQNDYKTMEFLKWFIVEQVEEEKNVTDLITKYELFGSTPSGLYLLDKELSARQ